MICSILNSCRTHGCPLICAIFCLILPLSLSGCTTPPPEPVTPPKGLAQTSKESGTLFNFRQFALICASKKGLAIPQQGQCADAKEATDEALNSFVQSLKTSKKQLALDIPHNEEIAHLKLPLTRLAEAMPDLALQNVCFRTNGGGQARCLTGKLRSESSVGNWMDALWPVAKLRLIVKSDGIEVVSIDGKIPGPDRFGPSVPTQMGGHDFPKLAQTMGKLAAHYPKEDEIALLMSPRTTFQTAAILLDVIQRASRGRLSNILVVY